MAELGSVTLIGSGETAHIGGQIFEMLARSLSSQQLAAPIRAAVLETPAGFETNASRVAGRVVDFMRQRLQNYAIDVRQIAARKKGTAFSPDEPEIVAPLYESQIIFFGPGSPTYTVRQLQGSLAWDIIRARQRAGAALVLASAATIAVGSQALPVYEIFKAGEDLHWKPGLDFFAAYNLSLVIVPHWNNREGGEDVDTSRCFIGRERFDLLAGLLPDETTLLGIDEQTALTVDFNERCCSVRGSGKAHILRAGRMTDWDSGSVFSINELGDYRPLKNPSGGLPPDVWQAAQRKRGEQSAAGQPEAPESVLQMAAERQAARAAKNWALADQLRARIQIAGWQVSDGPEGPRLKPVQVGRALPATQNDSRKVSNRD